jgi:hypothetical protein
MRPPDKNSLRRASLIIWGLAGLFGWLCMLPVSTGASPAPATLCLDGTRLQAARERVQHHDPVLMPAVAGIRSEAETVLREPLWAVTDKPFPAPSGSKHDYVSLSKYFWPNPATTSGLPYVQRDGEANPENERYDFRRLERMSHSVRVLALAYYFTGDPRYGRRAAEQLRQWFLASATRMNPNLNYAQLVKGKNAGSRWGIIDSHPLIRVLDAEALLDTDSGWSADDHRQLQSWFARYADWLQTSKLGREEAAADNNHGCYYDLQVADFALFSGQPARARAILEQVKTRRIAEQIEPDGSMPRELARTLSYDYTIFNLCALFELARLGDRVGVDLWHFQTGDGRSIRGALDWLLPFATGKQSWTHPQISRHFSNAPVVGLLRQAAVVYREPAYEKMISELPNTRDELAEVNLLWPLPANFFPPQP